MRRLARHHKTLTDEIGEIDLELRTLITEVAPTMLSTNGYGVLATATLLVSAGDNPERLRSDASFAAICGAAPIPAQARRPGTASTAAATHRRTGHWTRSRSSASPPTRRPADPQTKTYAAKLHAAGKE